MGRRLELKMARRTEIVSGSFFALVVSRQDCRGSPAARVRTDQRREIWRAIRARIFQATFLRISLMIEAISWMQPQQPSWVREYRLAWEIASERGLARHFYASRQPS